VLEQALKNTMPNHLKIFPKLTSDRDPCHFDSWDVDKDSGETLLRYWFWNRERTKKNKKRVFVREMESLLRKTCHTGAITRGNFESYCPRTNSDGGCGFAVIISILEYFHLVERCDRGVYDVLDRAKILQLLGDQ